MCVCACVCVHRLCQSEINYCISNSCHNFFFYYFSAIFISFVLLLLLSIYFQTTYIQLLAARNYVFAHHLQASNSVFGRPISHFDHTQ